ncbi:MAG: hypothetical protein L0177_15440 [Chloroflexi bacterium]|nr:hypothetical protein [Chloroflexota bacterium]
MNENTGKMTTQSLGVTPQVEIEWLILADAAQVVNQKLYLMGGGWNRITVQRLPPIQHQMAVALAIKVPWARTNERHDLELEVADGDGLILTKINGQFEVGRPPGTPPGQPLRTQVAFGMILEIRKIGTFEITARVNGEVSRQVPFYVIPSPSVTAQLHKQASSDENTSR